MSTITADDMDARIEASLNGWYRAYVYIVQLAPDEAYMRIPRVVVYDSAKKVFIQRDFAGFRGAEGPAFFPVFASLQQPAYSMPPEFDASGESIPADIEWSDAEWRNGDRLVEILCGPEWGNVATECEETVICNSSAKLWDWNICIEKGMRECSIRTRDHLLKCGSHGRIESLSDLSPRWEFLDNVDHVPTNTYRLVEVGPPLLCRIDDSQAYMSHLSLCSDGTYEPVLADDDKQAKSHLGMFTERDGMLLVSPDHQEAYGDQLNKNILLDPPARSWLWGDYKKAAHAEWNKLIAKSDLIEVTAVSESLLIQEPMRRMPPFLQWGRSHSQQAYAFREHSVEGSMNTRLLVRIPIAHYKSGRSVVQWKKAADSDGKPVDLDPSRAHKCIETGQDGSFGEGSYYRASEEWARACGDFTGYQFAFCLLFYDQDGDCDDVSSGALDHDIFCYTAKARTEQCYYGDPEALEAADRFLYSQSGIEECVSSHGIPYKSAHIEYEMYIHRWVDGIKVEEDTYGSDSYVIC